MTDHFISDSAYCPTCAKPILAPQAYCTYCDTHSSETIQSNSFLASSKNKSTTDLASALKTHQARRDKATFRHRTGMAAAAFCLFVLVTSVFFSWLSLDRLTQVIGLIAFMGCIIYSASGKITHAQYKALAPRDPRTGKLQCLYCGHTGIYRHTPYRSSQTLNDCSRCHEHLYVTGAVRR